jgi:HEPN domain-containing protein
MFEFLKDRDLRFYKEAQEDLEKEYYDFCLFHVEQMLQHLLKYLIAIKIDDFPRTHSLSRLFKEVAGLYREKVMDFYKENVSTITALEESYIGARYLDIEFDKEIAGEVLNFWERSLKLLEELTAYGNRDS